MVLRRSALLLSSCVIVLTTLTFVSGCAGDRREDARQAPTYETTPLDAERLTTFANPKSVVGDLVYVPVYSSVFHITEDRELLTTVTLSIHNVNLRDSIQITAVAYFNTEGRRIREFVQDRVVLGPLATKQYVIPEMDTAGGTGANFLVKWESEKIVARPIIESLMISTSLQQGLSFTCQGTVIQTLRPNDPVANQE